MLRRTHVARVVALAATIALLSGCAWIRQADVSLSGTDANQIAQNWWVSGNGRYVYFTSQATNLVQETAGTEPSESFRGIFRRDNLEGRTILLRRNATLLDPQAVSQDHRVLLIQGGTGWGVWNRDAGTVTPFVVDSAEQPIAGSPKKAALSADGRFVAFRVDSGAGLTTYLRDLQQGTTRPLTTTPSTDSNRYVGFLGGAEPLSLSRNGAVLATADCVRSFPVPRLGPTCLDWEFALVEVTTGAVSHPIANQGPRGFGARLSDNARIVAYWDGNYVRAYNRISGVNQVVSVGANGQPATADEPSVSANGRFVAFTSNVNLTQHPQVVGSDHHVYVRDRSLGITTLVSSAQDLTPLRGFAVRPFISADGRYVTFVQSSGPTSTDPSLHWRLYTKSALIPRITDVTPDAKGRAQPVRVTITGSGFTPDATVIIGRQGHALFLGALDITETSISFDVGTDFGTPLGAYDVTVAIPGTGPGRDSGAAANCAGCFTVTAT